jgi:hypothetical protein
LLVDPRRSTLFDLTGCQAFRLRGPGVLVGQYHNSGHSRGACFGSNFWLVLPAEQETSPPEESTILKRSLALQTLCRLVIVSSSSDGMTHGSENPES